ncbi:hypothetical protein [Eoetvoesiella caeni]
MSMSQLSLPLGGFPTPDNCGLYDKELASCIALTGTKYKVIVAIYILEIAPQCFIQASCADFGVLNYSTSLIGRKYYPVPELAVIAAAKQVKQFSVGLARDLICTDPKLALVQKAQVWANGLIFQHKQLNQRQHRLFS